MSSSLRSYQPSLPCPLQLDALLVTSSDTGIHVPGAAPALLSYIGHASKFIAPGRVCPHDRRTAD
ncbi:MAG: hypothetical protein WA759_02610, partial [Pseudolabrys sp.]